MKADYFISDEVVLFIRESLIMTFVLPQKKFYLTYRENSNMTIGKYLPCDQMSMTTRKQIGEWWVSEDVHNPINDETKQHYKQLIENILTHKLPDWQVEDMSGFRIVMELPDIAVP